MQCRALIAVFLLAAVSHAEEAPASLPDMDIGATVLGLQRTMTLVRAKVPLEEDSAPNLHAAAPARRNAENKYEDNARSTTASPIPYAAASLLGLQRSVKLTRTEAVLEEDEEDREDSKTDKPQLADVSVLGLQRSTKLGRSQAPLEEEEEEERDRHRDDGRAADARSADASILGLQRSVKLSRTEAPLDEEDLFDDDELQLADVSVLGLQRSVKVLSRNKAPPVVEDDLHESVLEV